MSITPTQIRTIDPFSDYNSNVTNRLTRFVTRGENCVHGPHGVDVSIASNTAVTLLSGYCFKDDVLIHLSENTNIDFTDVNSYFVAGTPLDSDGYYYICLRYSYIKTRNLPAAEVGILRPADRPLLESTIPYVYPTPYMLLKVVQVVGGVLTEVLNFDPENPTRKRKFSQTYVSLEDTLPTPFDRTRDEGRLILCLADGEFYFGTWQAWVNFNTSHAVMKTDEIGIEKGDIVYIDDNTGLVGKAIATSFDTLARAAVLTIGDTINPLAQGKVCLFGKVEQVNLETGITVTEGDTLFLSELEAGKVTNVTPASFQQFIGTSLTTGDTTAQIWFVPNLKGGGGSGSGSTEDVVYMLMLEGSSFEKLYYDVFSIAHTVTESGVVYNFGGSYYSGVNGDYIISPELLDSTATIYKFFVHVEKDPGQGILQYTIDDGTSWTSILPETTISIPSGFNSLKIKMTWIDSGNLYSFGVLYKEAYNSFMTDTKMLKKYVVPTDLITPTIALPENAIYINDGKSLQIYRNGVRQIIDTHYTEVDNTSVAFLVNLLQNDIIIFEEHYGYVDVSFENKATLDGIIAGTIPAGNADLLDHYHARTDGNLTNNYIPVADTTANPNLNSDLLDGYDTSTSSDPDTVAVRTPFGVVFATRFHSDATTGYAPLAIESTTKVNNLNVDQVDGYHVGNSSGQIPVSDGTSNTNLNADMVDGYHLNQDVTISSSPHFNQLTIDSTSLVNNLNADTVDGYHLNQNVTISSSPRFNQLTIDSTSVVTNLNSDTVDGYHASSTPGNSTIVVTDSTGKINSGWINSYSTGELAIPAQAALYSGSPFTHGLGTVPTVVQVFLKCINASGGYSSGDIVPTSIHQADPVSSLTFGASISLTSTTMDIRGVNHSAGQWHIVDKSNGNRYIVANSSSDWTVTIRLFVL